MHGTLIQETLHNLFQLSAPDMHYEEPIDGNFHNYTADILRSFDNTDSSESETDQEDTKQL